MIKVIKKIFILLVCFLAQFDNTFAQRKINIIAFRDKSTIKLRWAPDNVEDWLLGMRYGYRLEKYEIYRTKTQYNFKKVKIDEAGSIVLSGNDVWEKLCNSNDQNIERYASIAAQAMFGEDFILSNSVSGSVKNTWNKAIEQSNRFSYAMFSADQCWQVAEASGIAYFDQEIEELKNYFYRIYLDVPDSLDIVVDTGNVIVKHHRHYELPKPSHFAVEFKDGFAQIKWDFLNQEHIYNSYIVEKSSNESTFYAITETPIIPTLDPKLKNRYVYITDSIAQNEQVVAYRLKGCTPFNMNGPYTDAITGNSRPEIKKAPIFEEIRVFDNIVHMKWSIQDNNIRKFRLYRSSTIDHTYKIICDSIHPSIRQFKDKQPLRSNYYIVEAENQIGLTSRSYPKFIQLTDSLPPSKPHGLKGCIDTSGNVQLSWNSNADPDLVGYRVFRSNFRNHEYSQITSSPVSDSIFHDFLNINTLTDSVYYKIQATDKRFNNSGFSNITAICKPDRIPPVAPVFRKIENSKAGIILTWNKSSSKDVVTQLLFRKKLTDSLWYLISEVNKNIELFKDTILDSEIYNYTLVAVDDVGYESIPAKPIIGQRLVESDRKEIKKVYVVADREKGRIIVNWLNDRLAKNYIIYRSENNEPLSWYATVRGSVNRFYDENVVIGNSYRYGIKQDNFGSIILLKQVVKF